MKYCVVNAMLLIGVLTACQTPSSTPLPLQQSTSKVIRDCFWDVTAKVWLDINANGVWEMGELPFPGVEIWAQETPSTHVTGERMTWATSDKAGQVKLTLWLAGCPKVLVQLHSVVPDGFQLTTQDESIVVSEGELIKTAFVFGLTHISNTALPLSVQD